MVSHVVFVDNDEGHIQDVLDAYPSTLFIKIDEERSNWPDCPSSRTIAKMTAAELLAFTHAYLDHRVDRSNRYAGMLREERIPLFKFVPNRGLEAAHLDEIEQLAHKGFDEFRLYLDFDRTLSQSEGVVVGEEDHRDPEYIHDMADVLFGRERKRMLRQRLADLRKRGVQIYVLTANPTCARRDSRFQTMLALIRQVMPFIDEEHVLCSSDYGGSKGAALLESMNLTHSTHYRYSRKSRSHKKSRRSRRSHKKSRRSRRSRQSQRSHHRSRRSRRSHSQKSAPKSVRRHLKK
jgi:hypothetical protein